MKESVSLFKKEGASDKEYHVQLEESAGGWVVNFQYGRRGKALQAGAKTQSPIELDKAKKVFDKLVASKTGDGYTTDVGGQSYKDTDLAGRDTGLRPMLSNPFEPGKFSVEDAIASNEWFMQEKFDGERQMLRVVGGSVVLANRKGLSLPVPESLHKAAVDLATQKGDFIVDAERIGDALVVFDCLMWEGKSLDKAAALTRAGAVDLPHVDALEGLPFGAKGFYKAQIAQTTEQKRAMIGALRTRQAEGAICKKKDSFYVAGRPASLGASLKEKFVETASVRIAAGRDGKRSVSMEVLGVNGQWINVGNVTIPENKTIPEAGQIAEVRYLYRYPNGSLVQPVYIGLRSDLDEADLSETKLKIKESERAA